MQEPVYQYFACANTCRGFVNYFPSVLQAMNRVFILKGGPGTGKSTLMKRIGEKFIQMGEQVEYIYCSSDTKSLDGVILSSRRIAVVDGTAPHVIEPTAPGAIEEYINLGVAWDREKLIPHREKILELNQHISEEYREIYRLFAEAKQIHDRWERVYLDHVDYAKLDQAAEDLIAAVLKGHPIRERKAIEVHRFFGALQPDGSINYIENLTQELNCRYFIKGRPGTGKSTLMKKLAAAALEVGLDVEVYHCGFDAESLDMVIVRELGVCVFDATAPHELFPSRESDVILDLYAAAVESGTDEANTEALSLLSAEYGRRIQEAQARLEKVHQLHDALEEFYIRAVDFSKIEEIQNEIITAIAPK